MFRLCYGDSELNAHAGKSVIFMKYISEKESLIQRQPTVIYGAGESGM
jgi:hypothetical protein